MLVDLCELQIVQSFSVEILQDYIRDVFLQMQYMFASAMSRGCHQSTTLLAPFMCSVLRRCPVPRLVFTVDPQHCILSIGSRAAIGIAVGIVLILWLAHCSQRRVSMVCAPSVEVRLRGEAWRFSLLPEAQQQNSKYVLQQEVPQTIRCPTLLEVGTSLFEFQQESYMH